MDEDKKISNDPRLNEISVGLENETVVAQHDADGVEIEVTRAEFTFSAPYRRGEDIVTLARYGFGGRDFFYKWDEMTAETARGLAESYFKGNNKAVVVDVQEVNPAVYDSPRESLDKGAALNAFEAKGLVYMLTKAEVKRQPEPSGTLL